MCGKCTRFVDTGKFCESCTEAAAVESFINAKSQAKADGADLGFGPSVEPHAAALERPADRDSVYIWGGIGGSVLMVCLSIALNTFHGLFAFDDVTTLRKQDLALENCRLVFEHIGNLLEQGEMPDDSLRCSDSVGPNLVSQDGDLVRVAHPNPGIHGYSQIYVTSDSGEVVFVEFANTAKPGNEAVAAEGPTMVAQSSHRVSAESANLDQPTE